MSRKQGRIEKALRIARRLIATGWTRGKYFRRSSGKDCYCIRGACNVGDGQQPDGVGYYTESISIHGYSDTELFLGAHGLHHTGQPRTLDLASFNDSQTTKAPILAAFERAIAVAKNLAM